MKFNIRGQKIEVTPAIKEYAEKKIGKLNKYFSNADELVASILLKIRGKEQIVEVTIPIKKIVLRAEETNKDLYAAIDLVSEKLERQIRKNKTRITQRKNKTNDIEINVDFDNSEIEEAKDKVVKRKQMDTKPMSEEEAILQMNMLGHEFFIYKDAESGNTCILYKRKDGDLGIIETK
ncbi:MAG: ribosome-associated translation inhibitor RaiA [Bacilli bacterium]|nr:ribosome-associated translation inhibitor RaiA [Bacilli bacterium]MCI9434456.1 ribosome-associated translation inhibitor RaiA [Bacilli bacterium]